MKVQKQTPGLAPRDSRDQLGGWLHSPFIASDLQPQTLASRFCLSPWMARDMARLCFGEGCND